MSLNALIFSKLVKFFLCVKKKATFSWVCPKLKGTKPHEAYSPSRDGSQGSEGGSESLETLFEVDWQSIET